MQLAMIGAGRMGANMSRRLRRAGHEVLVHDLSAEALEPLKREGFDTYTDLESLVVAMDPPRIAWVMIPTGYVGDTVDALASHLRTDDIVVDGGNSWYRDAIDRAAAMAKRGIHFVDCGVSGGVFGLRRGYCLMLGGSEAAVSRLDPILETLAPGVDTAPRTRDRAGPPSPAECGYLHCGQAGAGHFVKMVHNGVEYALMAAYAEGFNILRHADLGLEEQPTDAESTPVRDRNAYQYDFEVAEVAELWRRGSVVGSWLLDLTAHALHADPELDALDGRVSDSGEGRWTVQAAVDLAAPAPVISAALYSRFASRGGAVFAGRVLRAMRKEFRGHDEHADRNSPS